MPRFMILILISLLTTAASGDQWRFKPERIEDKFNFGNIKIVRVRDSRKNQQYPEFSISIHNSGELVALIKGVSFEHIYADKNNSTFVGLSNSGLPGTAFVSFNRDGELTRVVSHFDFDPLYCEKSISIQRTWVHQENPDVKFHYEGLEGISDYEYLSDVSFVDCNNNRVFWNSTYKEGLRRFVQVQDAFDKTFGDKGKSSPTTN